MRKISVIIALMLMSCIGIKAQEYSYEAKAGWTYLDLISVVYILGEDATGEITYGPKKTVGIFSADFNYEMKKWLSVGGKVNYRNSWCTATSLKGESIDRISGLTIMPTVTFTTGFESTFRYYATLGLGAGVDLSSDSRGAFAAFQITPFGIAVGKKLSWYLELGLSNTLIGFITGISWRF